MGRNFANEITMTIQAISVKNGRASRTDSDRFFEILQRERLGMVIAVGHLRQPLAEKIVRDMAIVASGEGVVAGLLPAVKLIAHDMTVYACSWVSGKVAGASRIIKCVPASACTQSDENGKQ
jgi:hypothetical protein